jgi:hypothetical protein
LAQLLSLPDFRTLKPELDYVIAAIKADAIAVNEPLPGSDDSETFDSMVCAGRFVNSFENMGAKMRAVPRLSAFQLWMWVTPEVGKGENALQEALRLLLEVDATSTAFTGYSFEYFMFHWENLTQIEVFQHKLATSILGRYLRKASNELNKALGDVDAMVQFSSKERKILQHSITMDLCTDCYSWGHIYFIGKSNPGFDYFYRERTIDSTTFSIGSGFGWCSFLFCRRS